MLWGFFLLETYKLQHTRSSLRLPCSTGMDSPSGIVKALNYICANHNAKAYSSRYHQLSMRFTRAKEIPIVVYYLFLSKLPCRWPWCWNDLFNDSLCTLRLFHLPAAKKTTKQTKAANFMMHTDVFLLLVLSRTALLFAVSSSRDELRSACCC